MKQYEFKIVTFDNEGYYADRQCLPEHGGEPKTMVQQLNELGAEGWQVVQVLDRYLNSHTILFQRERIGHPYRD